MGRRNGYRSIAAIFLLLLCLFGVSAASADQVDAEASDTELSAAAGSDAAPAKLNPVTVIFDHIADAHEWHIFSLGHTHVTLPLPVILYSRARGSWHCFLSSRFEHGQADYEGFALRRPDEDSPYRIVEVNAAGEVLDPSPINLSITKNVVGIFVGCAVMLLLFLGAARRYRRLPMAAPSGVQNALEPLILFVRDDIAVPSIGKGKADRFMPFLLTIFFFILINNVLGLIPIFPAGANLTGNITITMALAFFTFLMTTVSGNRHYWKHIFNTPGIPTFLKLPLPLMPIVEIAGMFTKPVVLMIRLFANMLAGHMIVLVFVCLIFLFGAINQVAAYGISFVSLFFIIFMTLLDVLVSFIQAYVFTMLSAIYLGMATAEEHH